MSSQRVFLVIGLLAVATIATPVSALWDYEWTVPGTYSWTVPAGVTSVDVVVVGGGGGGGGGGGRNPQWRFGSGGDAGATSSSVVVVTPGQEISVIVGAAGGGGTVSQLPITPPAYQGYSGGNGGQSEFGTTTAAGGIPGGGEAATSPDPGQDGYRADGDGPWASAGANNGGATGLGRGAGGGGGGANSNGHGGAGAPGYVAVRLPPMPQEPGYTPRYPRSDLVTTRPPTNLGTRAATLNGETTAHIKVWFEYGTKSNSYGYRTDSVNATGSFDTPIKRFPLIAGQTYYYRAACADGYGLEETFTLPALTPRPTTTYGAAVDQFLYSFEDGDTMVQDMAEATWSPYVTSLGALFFGLVIGGIFLNLAMKGHSIAIPTLLVMIIGVSLWSFVPPEFVIIAQAFLIVGLGGLVYYIYTKRKM